jgi:predicted DNA-binding transcriptional regulator YafY
VVTPGKESKKSNDSVMNVWCTDKNAWRSFKIENLVSIEIKND